MFGAVGSCFRHACPSRRVYGLGRLRDNRHVATSIDRVATKYGATGTISRIDYRPATNASAAREQCAEKTWSKSVNFLQDATPMFFIAGFAVTISQMLGLLDAFIKVLQPITVSWLQLPNDPRIATTFILGIVRRDFASFGLTEVNLTAVQAVTAMIVITLFVPCIATVGVMIKERGPKIALAIWFGSWIAAFGIGGLLARALPPLFAMVGQ